MCVTVIVGGQFGSEGKGKVARWYARERSMSNVIRVGGTNSGHTTIDADGNPVIFRVLPTAAMDHSANCILPPGSYFNADLLFKEMDISGIPAAKVKIHPLATIITNANVHEETTSDLEERIGSTLSGTGNAVAKRVQRHNDLQLAKDIKALRPFLTDTTNFLRNEFAHGRTALIEGTQGFGLSVLHTPYYPYATSRDTTAAGFVAEAGLSPMDVRDVVLVLRSFPIRVAGNSGPFPHEITWDDVTEGAKETAGNDSDHARIEERTSVTHKIRRVARFDPDIVRRAIAVNRPSTIIMNHMDYIPISGSTRQAFLHKVEDDINQRIAYCGYGPDSIKER